MNNKRVIPLIFSTLFLISNPVSAHHEEFYPINWDAMMEYRINVDPFKPKYFHKFPYGFITVACERINSAAQFEDEDTNEALKKVVEKTEVNHDLLALFLQCDAIDDMRHPPHKAVMQYSKMAKAYTAAYKLSAELYHGGRDANPMGFIDKAAVIKISSDKAMELFGYPDKRTQWLLEYYKSVSK